MATALSWTTGERAACMIVMVRGQLGLKDTAELRGVMQKCLAEQPAALLADLSGMSLGEEVGLSVFTAVHRQAAIWPGTPVLLCGPQPAVADLLGRHRYGALQVRADVDAAVREVTETGAAPAMLSQRLQPVPGAGRAARDLATEACVRWDLPDLVAPASLVVTELVANVVDHAGTSMTLQFVRRARCLHIAVREESDQPPQMRLPEGGLAEGGRGLMLVAAVAAHWGWMPARDGKVVWARLDI
jgi:hypothetical protein